MPDLIEIAKAYKLETYTAKNNNEMEEILPKVLNSKGPVLCELMVLPEETVSPRVMSIKKDDGSIESKPLEDMWPFLNEDEVKNNLKLNNL